VITVEPLAHIALHRDSNAVLADAVRTLRRMTDADSTFAAIRRAPGRYAMTTLDGLTDPRWTRVVVRSGRGLGGRAVDEHAPVTVADYMEDPTITADYRTVVGAEGLRGVSCVPVASAGGDGPVALLYAGARVPGLPGDRLVDAVARVADMTSVGLAVAAPEQVPAPTVALTPREQEVLALLAAGLSNAAIAERLVISMPTTKGHVRALLAKLEARSRLEAVANARALRLA
jgi:DNA-binding CsgD family transcriptional regulator